MTVEDGGAHVLVVLIVDVPKPHRLVPGTSCHELSSWTPSHTFHLGFHDSGWSKDLDHNDLRPFIIFIVTIRKPKDFKVWTHHHDQCFHHLIFMSFQTGPTLKLATLVVPHRDGAVEAGAGEVLAARGPRHPSHRPVETSSSDLNLF